MTRFNKEILYVISSSSDKKGKRVIVIYDNIENILFPGDEDDKNVSKLIGLDNNDLENIKHFFSNKEKLF